MKLKTFEKRTQKYSRRSNGYNYAKNLLTTGLRQCTCHTSGTGRFTSNIDRTSETIEVLKSAGLKQDFDFVSSNDSPRGGKTGNYVELTTKGRKKAIRP